MRNALKLLIVGSVAGLALGEPAFAQSFNPDFGTANTLPLAYAPQSGGQYQATPDAGRNAFAQAPERGIAAQDDAGNASVGYEKLLATH